MPRKGRRHPDSFTLIVVPHTEKASFSVRVPFWTVYVAAGLSVAALAVAAFFAVDYQGYVCSACRATPWWTGRHCSPAGSSTDDCQ